MSEKPIKPKPQFYAVCLQPMQEIAKKMGYNLIVHGSMDRDMDLIAVPWVDNPQPHAELLKSLCEYLGASYLTNTNDEPCHFKKLPGGRSGYIIDLNRGGKYNGYEDAKYYLDISITPLLITDIKPN